ncbi:MAG: hypothetical protein FWC70_05480 [Defluviitaleaceae bacterium]|nr:hypothetical protein [Defluviitaleaceae bacterium]
MKFELTVDHANQWFIWAWVHIAGRKAYTQFKVDTGCNALILSHRTLKLLGITTDEAELSKLPEISGALAGGTTDIFRKLGAISLYCDKGQAIYAGKIPALCHATRQTHDLLGTEVLRLFSGVSFSLKGNKFMELIQ